MKRYLTILISLAVFGWVVMTALKGYGEDYQQPEDYKGIVYEYLTCDQLQAGAAFNRDSLADLDRVYNDCLEYAASPANKGYGNLYCAFLLEQGRYINGVVQDLDAVYEIKCVRGLENE